jgi:cell division protein FtsN
MTSMQEKPPLQPPARRPRRGSHAGRSRLRSFGAGVGLVVTFIAGAWLSTTLMGSGEPPPETAGTPPETVGAAAGSAAMTEAAVSGTAMTGVVPPPATATGPSQEVAEAPSVPEPPPPPEPEEALPTEPPSLAPALEPLETEFGRQAGEAAQLAPSDDAALLPEGEASGGMAEAAPAVPAPTEVPVMDSPSEEPPYAAPEAAETAGAPMQAGTDIPSAGPVGDAEAGTQAQAQAPEVALLPPEPPPAARPSAAPAVRGPYTIQVGTFSVLGNADRLVERLARGGFDAYSVDWTDGNGRPWRAVRVGSIRNEAEARRVAAEIRSRSGEPASVMRLR